MHINNVLLYVKNITEISNKTLDHCLNDQYGITNITHSKFVKSLIYIRYKSEKINMAKIQGLLGESEITSRIVDM